MESLSLSEISLSFLFGEVKQVLQRRQFDSSKPFVWRRWKLLNGK